MSAVGGFSGGDALLAFAAIQQGRMNDEMTSAMKAADLRSQMAGDLPGFEEATRALFAGSEPGFRSVTRKWPRDVRAHAFELADRTWAGEAESA